MADLAKLFGIEPRADERGGSCPTCGDTDGFLNVGSNHYGTCDKHQVYWWIGANLFSCWQEEDRTTWQANVDLLKLRRRADGGNHPEMPPEERSDDVQF